MFVISEFNKDDRETLLTEGNMFNDWLKLTLTEEGSYFKNYLRSSEDLGIFNCTDNFNERQFGSAKALLSHNTTPIAYI